MRCCERRFQSFAHAIYFLSDHNCCLLLGNCGNQFLISKSMNQVVHDQQCANAIVSKLSDAQNSLALSISSKYSCFAMQMIYFYTGRIRKAELELLQTKWEFTLRVVLFCKVRIFENIFQVCPLTQVFHFYGVFV